MNVEGKSVLVIGGAAMIGSRVVDQLLTTRVGEVIVYDNFSHGCRESLAGALKDDRVRVFQIGS